MKITLCKRAIDRLIKLYGKEINIIKITDSPQTNQIIIHFDANHVAYYDTKEYKFKFKSFNGSTFNPQLVNKVD